MNIGIYGAGKWGMAIDFMLRHNCSTKVHSRNVRIINNFVSMDELLDCEYIVIAISAQHIHEFLENNKIKSSHKFLIASKGIDLKSSKLLSDIFSQYVDINNIAFISGPSFSTEVMESKPVALGIFSKNTALANVFKDAIKTTFVKSYISHDIVGAQIAGAYKNVIAIASGICDGMGLGNNARASLVSRGLIEICRFGLEYGASMDTFLGVAGSGDLFLTASSTKSRNFSFGRDIANAFNKNEKMKENKITTEGVKSAFAIVAIAKKKNIYTPIANEVVLILDGKSPKQSLIDLITRDTK